MEPAEWPADAIFLKTELQTGLIFADIALSAKYPDKLKRNAANARKAYDTALKFMAKLSGKSLVKPTLDQLAERLRSKLRELGEDV